MLIGKFLGITIFSQVAIKFKWASLPEGVTWRQIYGAGFLAGIGFTMSMFIAELAFKSDANIQIAKVGIIVDSLLAAIIGMSLLSQSPRQQE